MKIRSLLALFLLTTAPLFAQELPKPGAEHQLLAAKVGVWDATIESMDMTGKAVTSKGVSTLRLACGGMWLLDDFTADFGGMKVEGHGTTGYDPAKGKYVGSWCDSMSPALLVTEGTMDKSGKVLTMTGMAPNMEGKLVLHRMVTTQVDADTQTFEMYLPGPDGKEMKLMTITYKRRVSPAGGGKKNG